MDKEGQSVKFSSSQIENKKTPDFFVGSNDKNTKTRKTFLDKIKALFLNAATKIKNYFKHPIAGKHKIITIVGLAVIAAIAILITLSLTIWRPVTVTDDPSTPEEFDAWDKELNSIIMETKTLSDEDVRNYYADKIKSTKKNGIKYIDLTIEFARDLVSRGFARQALILLDALDEDDMDCAQIANYLGAYAYYYYATNRQNTENSMYIYYSNLQTQQEDLCQEEYPAINVEEINNHEE